MAVVADLIDVKKLTKGILDTYSIDFTNYAQTSFRRKIENIANKLRYPTMDSFIDKVLADKIIFENFQAQLVVPCTEFFRDPSFWRKLREESHSKFSTLTTIRIWNSGASTCEELFSLLILLDELGFSSKLKITISDISDAGWKNFTSRKYDSKEIDLAQSNYERFEGKRKFTDYLIESNGTFSVNPKYLEAIKFERVYFPNIQISSKFDLILSRNVSIYFNSTLQDKVFAKYAENMFPGGFLALGVLETIENSRSSSDFIIVSKEERIFKRK